MKDIREFLDHAWKTNLLGWAAGKTKHEVSKRIAGELKSMLHRNGKDDLPSEDKKYATDRALYNKIYTNWVDLRSKLMWQIQAYSSGKAGMIGTSNRTLLLECFELLGVTEDQLPPYDKSIKIWSPLSFTEQPPDNVVNYYMPLNLDDVSLDLSNWEEQFAKYYEGFVLDQWRMMGAVVWLDEEFDKLYEQEWDSSIDKEHVHACWKYIVSTNSNFFHYAKSCMAQMEFESVISMSKSDLDGRATKKLRTMTHNKHLSTPDNYIPSVGGVFQVNEEDLPEELRAKATVLPDFLKYGSAI